MDKNNTPSEKETFLQTTNLHVGTAAMKQRKMLDRIKYFEAKRSPYESFIETFASKFVATTLSIKQTIESRVDSEKMSGFWKGWVDLMLGLNIKMKKE